MTTNQIQLLQITPDELGRQVEQQARETEELCKRVDALETKMQRQYVLGMAGSVLRWIPMLDQWLF
jgi:hypothetical protein